MKQARKSSEDAQAAGYARSEKVRARKDLGWKCLDSKYLHTFILISGIPTNTQNIFINVLTELDDFKKIYFRFWVKKKFFGQKSF